MITTLIGKAGKVNFKSQSLVCLLQSLRKQEKKSKNRSNPILVRSVLGVERNEFGQIYVVHGLERSLHFSIPTQDFPDLVCRPYPLKDNNKRETSGKMNHLFVPEHTNYVSQDKKTIVFNAQATKGEMSNHEAINKCSKTIHWMFDDGLSECFSYVEKSRSGLSSAECSNADELVDGSCTVSIISLAESSSAQTSNSKGAKRRSRRSKKKNLARSNGVNGCALPTITCGWSTNNANLYKYN